MPGAAAACTWRLRVVVCPCHAASVAAKDGRTHEAKMQSECAADFDPTMLFHKACKPATEHRVGVECERFGLVGPACTPLPYHGTVSIETLFRALEQEGFKPYLERDGGPAIAMARGDANFTLEPGGQFELSSPARSTLSDLSREIVGLFAELVAQAPEITWMPMGFHPLARIADLPSVPKQRYPIMKGYFLNTGQRGEDMMWRTATTQVNVDFTSESVAWEKWVVATKLQPLVAAWTANSPFYEGKHRGRLSERSAVWLDVDPARTGLLETLWQAKFSAGGFFAQYAEWALNIPVFLIKRGGQATAAHQHTFAELLQHGFEGQRVTEADWDTHLSSLFPEVRLKRTLETRGADSLPTPHVLALAALWRGLLDDTETRQRLLGVIAAWSSDDLQRLRNALIAEGLRADFRGLPVAEACQSLVESARQGLESLGETRDWLAPLSDLASTAETLADRALKTLGREPQRAALAGYYAQALGAEHA